jgi:anti-anti-sigma regulatory factor
MTTGEREDEIEALKRRVGELEQAAAKFEALCAVMPDYVIILDNDGRYVELPITEITPVEMLPTIIGRRMHDFFAPDLADRLLVSVRQALETRQVVSVEYPLSMPHGEIWCVAKVKPLTETTVLWWARDVTASRELMQAQEELRGFLREQSTPLVPLADGVIAMPLIGMIDRARALEVTQNLLEGIVKHRAHTAILDITGVKTVDAEVAGALLGSARAAKLLGTQVILTGIAPQMAQALVGLDADLSGILTRGDLQGGIAHALERRRQGARRDERR